MASVVDTDQSRRPYHNYIEGNYATHCVRALDLGPF